MNSAGVSTRSGGNRNSPLRKSRTFWVTNVAAAPATASSTKWLYTGKDFFLHIARLEHRHCRQGCPGSNARGFPGLKFRVLPGVKNGLTLLHKRNSRLSYVHD